MQERITGSAGDEAHSAFTSTAGGVMTNEAGAITGELDLLFRSETGKLHVSVRYAGTKDWYTVSGGLVRVQAAPDDAPGRIVRHPGTPGPVVGGNEGAVSLEGFVGG